MSSLYLFFTVQGAKDLTTRFLKAKVETKRSYNSGFARRIEKGECQSGWEGPEETEFCGRKNKHVMGSGTIAGEPLEPWIHFMWQGDKPQEKGRIYINSFVTYHCVGSSITSRHWQFTGCHVANGLIGSYSYLVTCKLQSENGNPKSKCTSFTFLCSNPTFSLLGFSLNWFWFHAGLPNLIIAVGLQVIRLIFQLVSYLLRSWNCL